MEPISLGFYAVVCGVLSAASPRLGGFLPRLLTGAVVGVIAAALLPVIKGIMSGY